MRIYLFASLARGMQIRTGWYPFPGFLRQDEVHKPSRSWQAADLCDLYPCVPATSLHICKRCSVIWMGHSCYACAAVLISIHEHSQDFHAALLLLWPCCWTLGNLVSNLILCTIVKFHLHKISSWKQTIYMGLISSCICQKVDKKTSKNTNIFDE